MLIDTKSLTKIKPCLYYNQIYDDSFAMGIHRHNTLELMYVADGVMGLEYLADGKTTSVNLSQSNFVFIRPNVPHRIFFETKAQVYNIEFESQYFSQKIETLFFVNAVADCYPALKNHYKNFKEILLLDDKSEVFQTLKKLQRFLSKKTTDIEFELSFSLLIGQLLVDVAGSNELAHSENYGNLYIKKALAYAAQNLGGSLTVPEVCAAAGCSKVYLEKLFKNRFRTGINKKINLMRIERAKVFLRQSTASSISIGKSLGFKNNQSFINNFKAETGCTPSEYRNERNLEYYQLRVYEKAYFDEKFKRFSSYGKGCMLISSDGDYPENADKKFDTVLLSQKSDPISFINAMQTEHRYFFLSTDENKNIDRLTNYIDKRISLIYSSGLYDLFLGFLVKYNDYSEKLVAVLHKKDPTRRIMIYFPYDFAKNHANNNDFPPEGNEKIVFSPYVTDAAVPFDNYSEVISRFGGVNLWFIQPTEFANKKSADVTPTLLPNFGGMIYSDI